MQSIQHREVFDVSEVGAGESNDNTKDSNTFQQEAIVDVVLSMLKTILLTIVWVMLKLRLFLKVELQEMLIKMKSMTYLMLILI